eukprot:12241040-Alexandrium_andersonii.AAC.1
MRRVASLSQAGVARHPGASSLRGARASAERVHKSGRVHHLLPEGVDEDGGVMHPAATCGIMHHAATSPW